MIESISINGFKAHESRVIRPSPGVTCLVGETDAGKSSALGALLWALTNRPAGDGMIRHGEDSTRVVVKLDGRRILRMRGGGKNVYRLDGEEFAAFGQEVPQAIKDLASIDDVNIQRQDDGPFWLSLSPGECAREMNRVVDLSVIDRSLGAASAAVKRAVIEHEVAEKRSGEANGTLESLQWVPGMLDALNVLNERLERLAVLHSSVEALRGKISTAKAITPRRKIPPPDKVVAAMQAIRDKRSSVAVLKRLVDKAKEAEERLCRARSEGTAASESLSEASECPLCGTPLGS